MSLIHTGTFIFVPDKFHSFTRPSSPDIINSGVMVRSLVIGVWMNTAGGGGVLHVFGENEEGDQSSLTEGRLR